MPIFPLQSAGKRPAPPRPPRGVPEAMIQKAIVDYIAAAAPAVIVYAVPNASRRTDGGHASNAVPGLRKGVFDLALILPRLQGHLHPRPAFIEVKTAVGKLSPEQREFGDDLRFKGVDYVIARSIDDVRAAFDAWGVTVREHRA